MAPLTLLLFFGSLKWEQKIPLTLIIKTKGNWYQKLVIVGRPLTDGGTSPGSDRPVVISVGLESFFNLMFGLFKSLAIVYGLSRLSRATNFKNSEVVERLRLREWLPTEIRIKTFDHRRRIVSNFRLNGNDSSVRRASRHDQ